MVRRLILMTYCGLRAGVAVRPQQIIAAGGSVFDVGSDTGGSIRMPAHCCGITGIKPTSGRVPRTGHLISFGGISQSLTQLGPLARYVDDLALTLPALTGTDWTDPSIVDMPLLDPDQVQLDKLRVAWFADNGIEAAESDTVNAVRAAADALKSANMVLENA